MFSISKDDYRDYQAVDKFVTSIDKLMNHYDELSNCEKYNLLIGIDLLNDHMYSVSYKEIALIISALYGKNFKQVKTLSTNIKDEVKEDNSLFYINRLLLDCAVADDFEPKNGRYSYKEILRLIENDKIYPIFARTYDGYFYADGKGFDKETETDTQLYYDSSCDWEREEFLKKYPIPVFVPYEFNLTRNTGDGDFWFNEQSVTPENASAIAKVYPISKKEIISMARKELFVKLSNIKKFGLEEYEEGYEEEKECYRRLRSFYGANSAKFRKIIKR